MDYWCNSDVFRYWVNVTSLHRKSHSCINNTHTHVLLSAHLGFGCLLVAGTFTHMLCVCACACSGYLSCVPLWGDPRQTLVPPLCLHREHQVHPPGMVSVFVFSAVVPVTLMLVGKMLYGKENFVDWNLYVSQYCAGLPTQALAWQVMSYVFDDQLTGLPESPALLTKGCDGVITVVTQMISETTETPRCLSYHNWNMRCFHRSRWRFWTCTFILVAAEGKFCQVYTVNLPLRLTMSTTFLFLDGDIWDTLLIPQGELAVGAGLDGLGYLIGMLISFFKYCLWSYRCVCFNWYMLYSRSPFLLMWNTS